MRRPEPDVNVLSARDQALVVAIADGKAGRPRRADAESRLARIPNHAELVERQRHVSRALRNGPAATPRARAAAMQSRSTARSQRRPRSRLAIVVAGPVALAAVAFVLVTSFWAGAPAVAEAADLAALPAEQAAPPARAGAPLLAAQLDGIPFPDWGVEFGWHATGARDDTLGDRATRTVFYEHMGHRVGYTIVSGDVLELPAGAETLRVGGVEIGLLRDGDRDIAVFERDGHTCVLAGHVLERSTLVKLAAWQAEGSIRF